MNARPHLYFWLSFGFYINRCSAQELQLYTFNQEHCQTKCTHGLINNLDSCKLDLKIQFYESVRKSTLFYFEDIDDVSKNIFSLEIPSECTGYKQKANNYCTQIDKTTFNVTVIVPAHPKFSNVKLRGYLETSNGDRIKSNLLTFPEIHDSTNVTGKLLINEEIISTTEDCIMTIEKNHLTLEFDCFGTVTPCVIVIQVNDSVVNTTSGNHSVYRRTLENREELFINISYAACSMEMDFNSITCIIKQDSQEYLKQISTSDDAIIPAIVSCSVVALFLIAVIVYIYCRKKDNEPCKPITCRARSRKQRQNNVSQVSDGHTEAIDLNDIDHKEKTEKEVPEQVKLLNDNEPGCKKITSGRNKKDEKQDVCVRNSLISKLKKEDFTGAKNSIKNGADVNQAEDKKTALMFACEKRRYSICLELIEKGARLNERNADNATALMIVCENGSENIVKKLIEYDANLKMKNLSGHTPLMIACKHCHYNIAEMLIEFGSDLEMINLSGHTPLMIACKQGHYNIAEMLINRGAKVNSTDFINQTPLMAACEIGHFDMVSLLINKSANIKSKGVDGKTAFDIAKAKGHENICNLLREKM